MTDLTTRARELCEGGVNPELVRTVYELCEALESANKEVERLKAIEQKFEHLKSWGMILPDCDECKYNDCPRGRTPCLDCIGNDSMVDHADNFEPITTLPEENNND